MTLNDFTYRRKGRETKKKGMKKAHSQKRKKSYSKSVKKFKSKINVTTPEYKKKKIQRKNGTKMEIHLTLIHCSVGMF